MSTKKAIKTAKLLCKQDAEKHLATLNGEWEAEFQDFIFSDTFIWTILSKCQRVTVKKWSESCFCSKMGRFYSTGKTVKSSIKNLQKIIKEELTRIRAEFVEPFPRF